MGTYKCGVADLLDAITTALNNIEGDFDRETLKVACLTVAEQYAYVSDDEVGRT